MKLARTVKWPFSEHLRSFPFRAQGTKAEQWMTRKPEAFVWIRLYHSPRSGNSSLSSSSLFVRVSVDYEALRAVRKPGQRCVGTLTSPMNFFFPLSFPFFLS